MTLISQKSIDVCIKTGKMFPHQKKPTSFPCRNRTKGRFLGCSAYSTKYGTLEELREAYGRVCEKLRLAIEEYTGKRPDDTFIKKKTYVCER